MDWVRHRWSLSEYDLHNFDYAQRKCKVIRLSHGDHGDRETQSLDVTSDEDWQQNLIHLGSLGSGAVEPDQGLSYLPFSRPVFECILERFFVHNSVARTILRNYAATFSRAYLTFGNASEVAIVYNCRSSSHWENDLALSITYFPEAGSIYAVYYGCNDHSTEKTVLTRIGNRLSKNSEDAFSHPMLLVGVFVEIERARMRELVSTAKIALQDIIDALQVNGYSSISRSVSPVDPWLNIYTIKNGLECWAKLLLKMTSHIDELDQDRRYTNHGERFRATGLRIKDRLEEIHLEYQGLVKECDMIIDGMTLATNLTIARDNMNDGKQMKSIALVTMVFLPATFVATLFSMTFFNLDSSYIWLYPSITIPLTVMVLSVYVIVIYTLNVLHQSHMRDPQSVPALTGSS
ncbi:hypothetical protein F5Y19DRAFT_465525 [Xylariaceae sp. FL1651]|nr:hypothetical protein F5Y19DRAFT_465525 [Xylariaceae sp. FL1651]